MCCTHWNIWITEAIFAQKAVKFGEQKVFKESCWQFIHIKNQIWTTVAWKSEMEWEWYSHSRSEEHPINSKQDAKTFEWQKANWQSEHERATQQFGNAFS